jgi:group I intron endonuclease
MYVYLITNQINDKKYVGITNDYKKRWANHKCCNNPTMAIAKAIKKYGVEHFKFELIEENVPLNEIDEKEIYYIQKYESHVSTGKGYNISKGGRYNIEHSVRIGTDNGRAVLTEEQVKYIKSHRNIPEMVLYEEFCDVISYEAFKDVYLNKTYTNIEPTSEMYPFNLEFSSQFNSGKLTYSEVVELREQYNNQIFWRDAYTEKYQKIYPDEMAFWNVYVGNKYKLVMPEVFTKENKHFQASKSHSGASNGRAKLTQQDVDLMRELFETKQKTRKEIQQMYSQVSTSSINNILRYATWKK